VTDLYTCARCRGTFHKGRSDAEAEAEYARVFPGCPLPGSGATDVVCDDCFRAMGLDPDRPVPGFDGVFAGDAFLALFRAAVDRALEDVVRRGAVRPLGEA
jgi:hypothetical protein